MCYCCYGMKLHLISYELAEQIFNIFIFDEYSEGDINVTLTLSSLSFNGTKSEEDKHSIDIHERSPLFYSRLCKLLEINPASLAYWG